MGGTSKHNGDSHVSVAAHAGGNGAAASPTQPQPGGTGSRWPFAEAHQQQLAAARRQIDALLKLNTLFKEDAALLAESLAKARRFAFHDELTELPNRRLLQDHVELAVAQGTRQHKQVVLLFLELDGFKDINDANRHAAVDRLLQQVASRLKASIRRSDTACRYGGDEFVVLLPDVESRDQAIAASEKIRAQLTRPYFIDGTLITMTASIGMATYPVDGENCDELIQAANFAMYRNMARTHSTAAPRAPRTDLDVRRRSNGHSPTGGAVRPAVNRRKDNRSSDGPAVTSKYSRS